MASRLATTVFYIEDPDSLRFALSVYDEFDVAALQPHFPGYPVFWAIAKVLYALVGSFAVAFSLIGGIATCVAALLLVRMAGFRIDSLEGLVIASLVVFNPLIWLMSNRYMPDLSGLAAMLAALYYLTAGARWELGSMSEAAVRWESAYDPERPARPEIGMALAGLLAGLRLSYMPFLLVPMLVSFFTSIRRLRCVVAFAAGVAVWLVPLVVATGWRTLVDAAGRQAEGHFTEFGGTIGTEPDLFVRILRSIEAVWADGFGAFWWERHPLTLIVAGGLLLVWFPGVRQAVDRLRTDRAWQLHLASWFLYGVWMLFYQNVIYKSRHVLPLLPFLILVTGLGAAALLRSRWIGLKILSANFLVAYAVVGIAVAVQHRSPTAIARAKSFVASRANPADAIISIPLVNYFLAAQGVEGQYVSIDDTTALTAHGLIPTDSSMLRLRDIPEPAQRLYVVGRFPDLHAPNRIAVDTFYHNPYVNRMWPEVEVHVYEP